MKRPLECWFLAPLALLQATCATAPSPKDVSITRLDVAFFGDRPGLLSQERTTGSPYVSDAVVIKAELTNPLRGEQPAVLVCMEKDSVVPQVQRHVRLEAGGTRQVMLLGFMASVVSVPIRCRLAFADRAPTPWVHVVIPANDQFLDRTN